MKFYYQTIVVQFGVSNYIPTGKGSNFVSHYTKDVLRQLGCRSVSITAFRPQINRLNQTLCRTIAKIARDKNERHEWGKYLSQARLIIRTLVNFATGFRVVNFFMDTKWSLRIGGKLPSWIS